MLFRSLNGVTLSLSTGAGGSHTIVGSHNAITSQTNQTVGVYGSSQTTGSASSGTHDARSLSFIGAGTPPNVPSWGNIMAEARSVFQIASYLILFPGIFLSLTVLAVNLLGDGLRDALDPRLARRM